MRIEIPNFQTKSELYSYLKENKKELMSQKKLGVIFSEASGLSTQNINTKSSSVVTKSNEPVTADVDTLRVKVVANTTNIIDSHMDLIVPGAYTKSIQERKNIIPHLHDHIHEIPAKVGEVVDIMIQNLSFAELGIQGQGSTEALIFVTDVMKSYNEKIFNQYKQGRINQHSIGLMYKKLELAINDPDSEKEYDFWEKYYSQVINKEIADEKGYFWVIQEIQVIENSAVLFGSNPKTPTLDNNVSKIFEPSQDTQNESEPQELNSEEIKNLFNENFKF